MHRTKFRRTVAKVDSIGLVVLMLLPMLCREIIKSQHLIFIFVQTLHGFRVLGAKAPDRVVEGRIACSQVSACQISCKALFTLD